MSEIRVTNVIGENGSSPVNFTQGINMSGIVTATSFVPTVGQLSHRNLVINGAMLVAQRGVSDVGSTGGYKTVDRFPHYASGLDENATQSQVDVASGTTPYTLGFRKAFQIKNGNQTSGAQAGDILFGYYNLESQDVSNSGWNYTSASSFITLSFWVKSSVAQNFYGYIRTRDGTEQSRPFQTGSLTADTWTKITKVIPGNSNIQIDNDANVGMGLYFAPFLGTDFTDNSKTVDTWSAYSSSARTPDNTGTWYTTNDATFEYTGVQLEVGSVATPFEHRSYGDELIRCQRYFQFVEYAHAIARSSTNTGSVSAPFVCEMRVAPTIGTMNLSTRATNVGLNLQGDGSTNTTQSSGNQGTSYSSQRSMYLYDMSGFGGMTAGRSYFVAVPANNAVVFTATSEL
tara:strand:- start:44 stop:1246 length:1203 start_codon:yes stop_codon:yes gene_type:complete